MLQEMVGGRVQHLLSWLLSAVVLGCASTSTGGTRTDASVGAGGSHEGGAGASGSHAGGERNSGGSGGSTGGDATFCTGLASGTNFASHELLWCSTGWQGPDAAPPPEKAPELYCHWTLQFHGSQVAVILSDYGVTESFTCDGNSVTLEHGELGSWDPRTNVLTMKWEAGTVAVQYAPDPADAGAAATH